jgi:hypothetical protein
MPSDEMRLILYLRHSGCVRTHHFENPDYETKLKEYQDMDNESDLNGILVPPFNIFDLVYLASRPVVIQFSEFASKGYITHDSYPIKFMRSELTKHAYPSPMDFYLEAIKARAPEQFVDIYIEMLKKCDHTSKTIIASRYATGRDVLEILARTREANVVIDTGSFNYLMWQAPKIIAHLRERGEVVDDRLDPFSEKNDDVDVIE